MPKDPTITPPECVNDVGSWCRWAWDMFQVDWLAAAAPRILKILVIVVIAIIARFLIFRLINRITRISTKQLPSVLGTLQQRAEARLLGPQSVSRKESRARSIASLLKSVTGFIIVVVTLILVLAEIGINVAPLLASAGIAGIALGFGAQNLVKDFLAGISMILEDQYGVGDTVDLGPATGTVLSVGLRTTAVRGADGTIWYVRNGEISRVGNSSQGEAVVTVDLPLHYRTDATLAGQIALETMTTLAAGPEFKDAVTVPPTLQGIVSMDTETVTIRLVTSVRAGKQWAFGRAARMAVKSAFDAAGLQTDHRPQHRRPADD